MNSEILKLAHQRQIFNGYDVAIVDIKSILLFDDPNMHFYYYDPDFKLEQELRTFIKRVYEGHHAQHIYDGKLGYVLLVGNAYEDNDQIGDLGTGIPLSKDRYPSDYDINNSQVTHNDYYFSCLTKNGSGYNDWDDYGDLFLGRLPVADNTDLTNIVEKICYGENEITEDSFKKKNLFNLCEIDPYSYDYFHTYLLPWAQGLISPPYYNYVNDTYNNTNWALEFVNFLNDPSCNTIFNYSHGSDSSINNGGDQYITTSYLEQNLQNNNKCPFMFSQSCFSGSYEHGSHPTDKGFGEDMVTYSSYKGFVGFVGSVLEVGMGVNNSNPFQPETLLEWLNEAIFQNLSFQTGEFLLEGKLHLLDPFQYNLLGDPGYNIMSTGYKVDTDLTLPCNSFAEKTTISSQVIVDNNKTLTIPDYCSLYFDEGGSLMIEQGSTLKIGSGVKIYGKSDQNVVYVAGTLKGTNYYPGNPIESVSLTALPGYSWRGIEICNSQSLTYNFQYVTVTDCNLIASNCNVATSTPQINIEDSKFENSLIDITNATLNIHGKQLGSTFKNTMITADESDLNINNTSSNEDQELCSFTNSSILAQHIDINRTPSVSIGQYSDCSFSGNYPDADAIIKVIGYPDIHVQNCTISYSDGTGIDLDECGINGNCSINNCTIDYSDHPEQHISWGIKVYSSQANIYNNSISHGRYGVCVLNLPDVAIHGEQNDCNSTGASQHIYDNLINQVIACDDGFPQVLSFNDISNSNFMGNSNYQNFPLIYYIDQNVPVPDPIPITTPQTPFNVKCNHFPTWFDPDKNLFPTPWENWYVWDPPCSGSSCTYNLLPGGNHYEEAKLKIESGDFNTAETDLKHIIRDYPGSTYSKRSALDLLYLTKRTTKDFSGLKRYYDYESNFHVNSSILNVASWLSNKCNIEQGLYPEATAWFENKILHPNSLGDSIFAIIDLEFMYLKMNQNSVLNSGTNNYTGNLTQYKPNSMKQYRDTKEFLIRKLFEEIEHHNNFVQLTSGNVVEYRLDQIKPNPFSSRTQISYHIPKCSEVTILVNDLLGKEIKRIDQKTAGMGTYNCEIDLTGFPNSIYFVNLIVDKKIVDAKKIVKID